MRCWDRRRRRLFWRKLAHAFQDKPDPSVKIYFVARGRHLEMIRKNGLILKTSDHGVLNCKPALATDKIGELADMDVFIIGVKGFHLDEVSRALSGILREDTVILPLLNGVDIRERLRHHLRRGTILPACVYVSSHIEEPGVVVQSGKPGRIILGPDPDHPAYQPKALLEVLKEASISYDWVDNAYPAIWEKYIFIASFGLVSARFDKTLDEIFEDDHLRTLVRSIMEEIYQNALKKGYPSLPISLTSHLGRRFSFQRRQRPLSKEILRRRVVMNWIYLERP